MKKNNIILILLISIFAFSSKTFAASANISVSSGSVQAGGSFTVTASVIQAAAWNIHVTANGPVGECKINNANATDDAMDTNKSFSTTCTATGEGTITLYLSGDVTSATDGNAVSVSGSKTVTVTAKPASPSGSGNNNNNNNNNTPKPTTTDTKSKNNNLKEISVAGFELTKIDNNNYSLTVPNDITTIDVLVTAEDSKATVKGAGSHELQIGDNNIEVIIISESGSQNKINIKVTRKDGYYLEDLDSALKNSNDEISIIITSDNTINQSDLEKIKNSKKTVEFNYYNNADILMYAWIINGASLKETDNLVTTLNFDSPNRKDILKASNYADGIFISTSNTNIPEGTKLRIYVGNKYEDGSIINVYGYNKESLIKENENLEVKDGYIIVDSLNNQEYFITMSFLNENNDSVLTTGSETKTPITLYISIILALLCIVLAYLLFKKKNNKSENIDNIETPTLDSSLLVKEEDDIETSKVIDEEIPEETNFDLNNDIDNNEIVKETHNDINIQEKSIETSEIINEDTSKKTIFHLNNDKINTQEDILSKTDLHNFDEIISQSKTTNDHNDEQ